MSINKSMDNIHLIHYYMAIKRWTTAKCNVSDSHWHNTAQEFGHTRVHAVYDPTFMEFKVRQHWCIVTKTFVGAEAKESIE